MLSYLRAAMELSLELMSQGSYQVEMSDEGMMTEDIEECFQVVIKVCALTGRRSYQHQVLEFTHTVRLADDRFEPKCRWRVKTRLQLNVLHSGDL